MFEDDLIKAIRIHDCLYNKSIPSYRNKILKERAWQNVAAAVKAKVRQCQTRWRSLRDRFVREISKKPESGDYPWDYFNQMMFLKEHVATGRRRVKRKVEFVDTQTSSSTGNILDPTEESFDMSHVTAEDTFFDTACQEDSSHDLSTLNPTSSSMHTLKRRKIKGEPLDDSHGYDNDYSQMLVGENAFRKFESESRNINFLKLLDEYLQKLPDDIQDEIKIRVLNLVHSEIVNRRDGSQ